MACNLTKDQSQEFLKNPVVRAGVMDAVVDKYLKNGADVNETINGVANELGLHKEAIRELLDPKTLGRPTAEMWARQYVKRQVGLENKRLLDAVGSNKFAKAYRIYDNTTRRVTTAFHFSVFGKTHGGDNLFTNPVEYLTNFKNSLALPSVKGMAAHELRMSDMFDNPNYKLYLQSGADIGPRSEANAILGGGKSKLAHAAFEELQLRRFENIDKAVKSLLTPEERTVDNIRPIAAIENNRWGGGQPGRIGSLFGKLLFGPRLTPAQWRAAFVDNVNAVYHGIFNRGAATPGQLAAARLTAIRMGKLLAVYGSALGLEAAAAQAGIIDKRNMPNLTNPRDTGSFGRIKIFGKGVPLSPTIELLALPIKMIAAAASAKPNENPALKFLEPLEKYGLFRLSPGLSLATTVLSGTEPFSGRKTPFQFQSPYANGKLQSPIINRKPDLTKKGQPVMHELAHPKLTYTEFLGERLPIPAAVFLRDVYDSQRAEGVDHPTARDLISGAIAAATTGASGYEWHPDVPNPYKLAESRTPENASEAQRRRILASAMREFRRTQRGQPTPKEAFGIGQ